MEQYVISKEIKDALLQYLATKPYSEVAQAIQMLSNLAKVEEKKED